MDNYRVVEYDPFADDTEPSLDVGEPDEVAAPSSAPTLKAALPPAPSLRTAPEPTPAPDFAIVDVEPEFEDEPPSSPILEVGKGIGAGAVNTVGGAIKGAAPGRVEYKYRRQQELARRKAAEEGGFPLNTIDLPPEEQERLKKTTEAANASVEIGDILNDPFYRTGKEITDWSDEQFKAAEDFEGTWTRKISEGLGSTLPFLAAGALGPAGGAVVGGVTGSLSSSGEQLERAIKAGATKEQIIEAVKLGALPGFTEQAPIEVFFERIPLPAMGKVMSVVSKIMAKAAAEGGQEAVQQVAQNLIEKYVYDPEQEVGEGVLESALIGAAVGGIIAAPTTRPDQEKAVPGVEETVSQPDTSTPGGTSAATPPPPATVETTTAAPAPKKSRVRKKADQVEVVTPGNVPSDVAAATAGRTPEQVFAEHPVEVPGAVPSPELATTPPELVAPPAEAAETEPATVEDTITEPVEDYQIVDEEPEFDETIEEEPAVFEEEPVAEADYDEDIDFGADEDEADVLEAIRAPAVQERAASVTKVAPANEDTAAALEARQPLAPAPMPELPGTEGAVYRQPQPEVAQLAQPQIPQVSGPEVSSAVPGPTSEQVTPLLPGGAAQEAVPVQPPANVIPEQPLAPQEPVQTQTPLAAPTAPAEPAIVQEAAPAPATPVLSPIGRSLADTVRTELNRDPISEQPDFHQVVDQVVADITSDVGRGAAPAAIIRQRLAEAVATVRNRLEGIEADTQVRQAVEEEMKQQRAVEVAEATTVRRAGKRKGKSKEAVEKESELTFQRRAAVAAAKPGGDEDLVAYHRLRQARAGIKGRGKANEEIRAPYTKKMEEHRQRYAAKQKPAPKVTPTPSKPSSDLTPEQVTHLEQTKQPQSAAQKIEAARKRDTAVAPVVTRAIADVGPMTERQAMSRAAGTQYLQKLVDSVSSAMKAAGDKLGSVVDPVHNSVNENLVIYAKQLLAGKHKGQGMIEFLTAQTFANAGERAEFYGIMMDGRFDPKQVSISDNQFSLDDNGDVTSKRETGGRKRNIDFAPSIGVFEEEETGQGGAEVTGRFFPPVGPEKTFEAHTERGRWTIGSSLNTTGRQAIAYVARYMPKMTGVARTMRNMHMKVLQDLVGDADIMFLDPSVMQEVTGNENTRGLAFYKGPERRAAGEKSTIFIDDKEFNSLNNDAQRAHLIIHELTHAATMFSLETNFRGTNDIITELRHKFVLWMDERDLLAQLPHRYKYGLTDNHEFVAEAFSSTAFQEMLDGVDVSPEMAGKLAGLRTDRNPSWWDAFKAAVMNALGLNMFKRRGMSYMQAMLELHPTLMMSEQEQTRRSEEIVYAGADQWPNSEYGPVNPEGPHDAAPMMRDAEDRVRAKVRQNINANTNWFRTLGSRFATTEELGRRSAALFGGTRNAFTKLKDLFLSKRIRRKELREEGDRVTSEIMQHWRKNRKDGEALSDVLHEATIAQVDPSVPLGDPNNRHITKKGRRDNHRRVAHAKLSAAYNALTPEGQRLFKRVTAHYKKMNDQRVDLVVKNILEAAIGKNGVKLPAGVTVDQAVKWVTDGSVDRVTEEQNQFDKDMHAALGKTGKTLAGTKEMRRVKGTYVPLTRWGKNFFTATQKLDTPAGARVDPDSKEGNVFIFDDPKAVDRYTGSTDDQIVSVVSRWFDPKTGERSLKQEPDSVNRIYVTVQNKIMEMEDSLNQLSKKRAQYVKEGYTVSDIDEIENHLHSESNVLPQHIHRLLRNIDQGTSSDINKQSARAAVMSAYIRQLAGSRAQHRQLKRAGIKGFNRDLVHSTYTNNNIMAGHLTNLEMAPQFAEAEQELDEYLNEQRYAGGNADGMDAKRRRALVKELKWRIQASNTRNDEHAGSRLVNSVMELSFLKHLFSPAYTITNLTQPWVTTLPVLSGDFNMGSAMRALGRAYSDMGALTTLRSGFGETGREFKALFNRIPRLDPESYHNRIVRMLDGNNSNIKNRGLKKAAAIRLRELGFGTDSGIESPELSEIGKTKTEIGLHRVSRVARALPEAAEAVNRYATVFAAIDLAVQSGMDPAAAVDYAVTTVEKTQGGYAVENNPAFMQNAWLRLPLQFKKYGLMYAQLYYGNVARAINVNSDMATRKAAGKQIAYLSAMTVIMAGTAGLPIMELGKLGVIVASMLMDVGDWDDNEKAMQRWYTAMLEGIFGKGFTATKLAEMFSRGSTRAIGVDMSTRLGNDGLFSFGDPKKLDEAGVKSWLLDQAIGAPGGILTDMGKAISSGDWRKAMPLPKFVSDAFKAYDQHTSPRTTKAGKEYAPKLDWFDTLLIGGLGLNPATVARRYELGGSGAQYKEKLRQTQERQKVMGKWLNADPKDRAKIFRDTIRPWNKGKSKKDMIEYGDLTRTLQRRKTEARNRAREERANAN